jgi:hypothetical protein
MPTRSIAVLSSALVILGASLSAATAAPSAKPRGKASAGPAVRTLVAGVASDWDAGRRLVSLDGAAVAKGPKALRRAVRRGVTITLRISGGTRLIAVDADGHRARITPAELFDELDLADDDVDVEAGGRVAKVVRPAGGEIVIPASRVVIHLPPVVEDDPSADPADPTWDEDDPGADIPADDDPIDDEDLGEDR